MGKPKHKKEHSVSSGKTHKINAAREARRQEKFAKRKAEGKAYEYKSVAEATGAKKGSKAYWREVDKRKTKIRYREPFSRSRSIMAKLDNLLAKEQSLAAIRRAVAKQ